MTGGRARAKRHRVQAGSHADDEATSTSLSGAQASSKRRALSSVTAAAARRYGDVVLQRDGAPERDQLLSKRPGELPAHSSLLSFFATVAICAGRKRRGNVYCLAGTG
ncbi:hypothetical protein MTO96_040870 [Rhipicephalus appendiculatus]